MCQRGLLFQKKNVEEGQYHSALIKGTCGTQLSLKRKGSVLEESSMSGAKIKKRELRLKNGR